MDISTPIERTLTELDHARLVRLTRQLRSGPAAGAPDAIADALDMADLVSSQGVSPDIVTMNSRVMLADGSTGHRYQLTLCYPEQSSPATGFISVMSPAGASLLGLRVGDMARWHSPGGEPRTAKVIAIPFQPEASGDYTG
jgi:regulator of nucleoside diphosphate kinase